MNAPASGAPQTAQAQVADWKTYEVSSSGHDVMIDMPGRLVEILLEVA
jgi:hypothetical protein